MKKILLSITILFFTLFFYGQSGKVEGRITDITSNEPLPFVNVIIDGTNIGSSTDMDGKFIFTGISPGFVKLRSSFVGYIPVISDDILITNSGISYIEIQMNPSATNLESVLRSLYNFPSLPE